MFEQSVREGVWPDSKSANKSTKMRKLGAFLLTLAGSVYGSRIRFPDEFYDKLLDTDEISRGKKSVGSEPILPCPNGETFCEGDIEDYPSSIKVLDDVIAAKLVKNAIFVTEWLIQILVEQKQLTKT